jgi:hypothetical protein
LFSICWIYVSANIADIGAPKVNLPVCSIVDQTESNTILSVFIIMYYFFLNIFVNSLVNF